jgi:hypothetical protein
VRGAWVFEDGRRGAIVRPFPGLSVSRPLLVMDSLNARAGGGSDPSAFRTGLVSVAPYTSVKTGAPRSFFGFVNGDYGQNDIVLSAMREDPRSHVWIDALGGNRSTGGPYDEAGRHAWSFGLGKAFGEHELNATYRHAAEASRLLGGEEETARGASGGIEHIWRRDSWRTRLSLGRQWDERESFGSTLDPRSRRDAQEARVTGEVERDIGTRRVGGIVDWSRAQVARQGTGTGEFLARADLTWVGAWYRDTRPGRTIDLGLGGGGPGGVDRVELAPRARVDWQRERSRFSLWGSRMLEPAWHDLAPGQHAFLQNTWALGAEAARDRFGSISLLAGRTIDRVVVARLPLTDQWLRLGQRRDPDPWNFALVTARTATKPRALTLGAEGSFLVRDSHALQARVDPAATGTAWAIWSFHAFRGDLGVRVRLELDGIGPRVTDEVVPRDLPGFLTSGLSAGFSLADVVITLRVSDLENRRQSDIWVDSRTGLPAVGPARDLSLRMGWKLLN